jgi:hypothetical protein
VAYLQELWKQQRQPLLGNGSVNTSFASNKFLTRNNGVTGKRWSLHGPWDSYVTQQYENCWERSIVTNTSNDRQHHLWYCNMSRIRKALKSGDLGGCMPTYLEACCLLPPNVVLETTPVPTPTICHLPGKRKENNYNHCYYARGTSPYASRILFVYSWNTLSHVLVKWQI